MEEHRLHRNRKDRMLFGVCGGLAEYFDVDSTLVRLIFVLITFAGGSGIIAYIVLAIVMPSEAAVASSPHEVVRRNISDLGETARDLGQQFRTGFSGSAPQEGEVVEGQVVPPVATTKRDRNATAGMILILIGLLFLLSNLLPWLVNWGRLWPVILIAIGLAILWGRGRR